MLHYQFGIPFHIYVNPLRLNIFLPFSFSRKITLDQTLAPMCICNDTRSKSTQKKKEKKKSEVRRAQVQGWQWGGAGPKDGIFAPAPHGFFLPHPRPAPHDGENFLPHPRPLRPHEDPRSPALPRKTLFLINFPYNYYHFFK